VEPTTGKRVALNMKTTQAVRSKLEEAARASGRSLTAQVEWLVERALEWQEAFASVEAYKREKLAEIDAVVDQNKRPAAIVTCQHPDSDFQPEAPLTAGDVRKLVEEAVATKLREAIKSVREELAARESPRKRP
jgi:hypothetical protein